MFYWTLAWTLNNDSITFRSWGIQFALAIIQDFCVSQPLKVFVIHVAVIKVIRNQIRQIFNVLKVVSLADLKDKAEALSGFPDVRVVQFMSASCRAARIHGISQIPAARVLMKLGDYEFSLCREMRNVRIGVLFLSIIILPSLLAFADTRLQEVVLDVLLRSAWNGFLLVNAVLLNISPGLLAAPYIVLFLLLSYRIYRWRRLKRKKRAIGRVKAKYNHVHGWRARLRQRWATRPGTMYPRPALIDRFWDYFCLPKLVQGKVGSRSSDAVQKAARQDHNWRNMNLPVHLQGICCDYPVQDNKFQYQSRRSSNFPGGSLESRIYEMSISTELFDLTGNTSMIPSPVFDLKPGALFVRRHSDVLSSALSRVLSESLVPVPTTQPTQEELLREHAILQLSRLGSSWRDPEEEEEGSDRGVFRSRMSASSFVEEWRKTRVEDRTDRVLMAAESSFASLDSDNDGLLSGSDLDNLCGWVWITFYLTDATPTKTELDEVLDRLLCYMDPNHTGVICFPDFLIWFRTMAHHLTTLAQDYDATGTGTL